MWERKHCIGVTGIQRQQIWALWSDIKRRPQWDLDTEWAEMNGPFEQGAQFRFKPRGGPKLSMTITECTPNHSFTDCFTVPFARLYGIHTLETTTDGLNILTTIRVEGPLAWLLQKLVAEKVAKEVPQQTAMLIELARQVAVS